MSNLFEDHFPEEPFNVGDIENDDQRYLRERFDSLADRNDLEIACFDPFEQHSYKPLHFRTSHKDMEDAEPQLSELLMYGMLQKTGLAIPADDSPQLIFNRYYTNGKRAVLFEVARTDGSSSPVYSETSNDGMTPQLLCLLSYDMVDETVNHYRQLDKYREWLEKRITIARQILLRLSVEDLKEFSATFDDIQKL